MKKIVLLMTVITGFSIGTKAQTFGFQKGDGFLEGSIGISANDNQATEKKLNAFTFSPKAGYFIGDKTAVGIQFRYNQSKAIDYSGTNEIHDLTNGMGANLFVRQYLLEVGSRFKAFGEAGLGFSSTGGEYNNGTTTIKADKTNVMGINAGIGANFFLTDNIAIGYQFGELISFQTVKANTSGAKASNNFKLNLNSFSNFFNAGEFSLTFKL